MPHHSPWVDSPAEAAAKKAKLAEDVQDVHCRVMSKEDLRIANERATQTPEPTRDPPGVDTAPVTRAKYQELVPTHANRHSLNSSMRKFTPCLVDGYQS